MTHWKRLRCAAAGAAIGLALTQAAPARAEPQAGPQSLTGAGSEGQPSKVEARPSADNLCRALARAAADNGLPVEFLTRLIWLESRFNPDAVSPKGAQGIAQFMPRTASGRGLTDPFEPLTALREAASYLRELRTTFSGNLGLASAAYNAGPGRVEAWLSGRLGLPDETYAYVRLITGHSADAWASQQPPQWRVSDIPQGVGCGEAAKVLTASLRPRPPVPARLAWLAAAPSAEIAKLCRQRAIKAHPTQPPGSKQGHAQAQRDSFRDCVATMQRDKKA
jgi:Transglycosylase SLT domain